MDIAYKIKHDKNIDFLEYLDSVNIKNLSGIFIKVNSLLFLDDLNEQEFIEFTKTLEISGDQAKLAYAKLKSNMKNGANVIGACLLDELKRSYTKYVKQFVTQLELQGIDIVKNLERFGPDELYEVFGRAKPNSEGIFDKNELAKLLKEAYPGKISSADIKTIMNLLQPADKNESKLASIQEFLKKYTISKKVFFIFQIVQNSLHLF